MHTCLATQLNNNMINFAPIGPTIGSFQARKMGWISGLEECLTITHLPVLLAAQTRDVDYDYRTQRHITLGTQPYLVNFPALDWILPMDPIQSDPSRALS